MANNGLKLSTNVGLKNTFRTILVFALGSAATLAALIFLGVLKNTGPETKAQSDKVLVDQFRLAELENYKIKKEAEEAAERKVSEQLAALNATSAEAETASLSSSKSQRTMKKATSTSQVAFNNVSASVQESGGVINWSTATEMNSSVFLVERSNDGVDYSLVGMKVAKGTSFTNQNYEFQDKKLQEAAMPTVFYRVRHVGLDGTSSYSGKTEVSLPAKLGLYTQVNKDQSKKSVTLRYASDTRTKVNMKITHQDGTTLLERTLSATPVSKSIEVTVDTWPRGNYFVHMFDDRGSTTESFVLD